MFQKASSSSNAKSGRSHVEGKIYMKRVRKDYLRRCSFGNEGRLKSPLPIFFVLFFLLFSCLPKRQIVYERRIPPSEKREIKKEVIREERPVIAKTDIDRVEKRETRGVQYGIASWYGPDFHGKPTSSGEIYDMYQLTCAHNTLALGTTVIVTNLENGKSLEMKVNDRGPFVKERIIDLSYSAAKILGIWEKGTAFVKVETIGPWIEEIPRITLQVGSFTEEAKAQRLAEQLREGFKNVHVTRMETSVQTYYRVRIGPFETKESARRVAEQLSQTGYQVLVTSR
jgi:rare lipoprotein A